MVENSIKSVIEAGSDELKKLTESLDYDVVITLLIKSKTIRVYFFDWMRNICNGCKKNCSYYASG